MLVLNTRLRESIHLGCGITITLVRIRGNQVCIGIEAPAEIRVLRGELVHRHPQAAGRPPPATGPR